MKKFENLSDHAIYFLLTCEFNDQGIGQAYDGGAAGYESPVHAVVIGAVGFRYGDFSVPHGDNIVAAVGSIHGEFLVKGQGNGTKNIALASDDGSGCVTVRGEEKCSGNGAEDQ